MAQRVENTIDFIGLADRVERSVRLTIKQSLQDLYITFLNIKNYTTRSGVLDRAYSFETPSSFFGGVYLEPGIAI